MLYTCPNLMYFVFNVLRNGLPRYMLYTSWKNSALNPRHWEYVYQFVYRHNKDLWETIWRSKTTFCVVVHISWTSYKNRKTSDCVVNQMILDYANVWRHRASRRRVTLFLHVSNWWPWSKWLSELEGSFESRENETRCWCYIDTYWCIKIHNIIIY